VKKTRQNKNLEPGSDFIGTGKAPDEGWPYSVPSLAAQRGVKVPLADFMQG
jgi:hypothetical protein